MHPGSIPGEASSRSSATSRRRKSEHPRQSRPSWFEPAAQSDGRPSFNPARKRHIDRQDDKSEWDHPESEEREKAENPAQDQRAAEHDPQDRMIGKPDLASGETDMGHEIPLCLTYRRGPAVWGVGGLERTFIAIGRLL